MNIYLQGLTMGLAYVAPIGAQNLFMIQTAMGNDRKRAFLTALILFCFDAALGIACFFGAGALMTRFPLLQKLILCGGSLILLWTGLQLLRSKAQTVAEQAPLFVMGTASASCLWFFGMTALLSFFREKISGTVLLWINRACGCVLMFYGALCSCCGVKAPAGPPAPGPASPRRRTPDVRPQARHRPAG